MSRGRKIFLIAGLLLAAVLWCCAYARSPAGLLRRGKRELPKVVAFWRENEAFFDELAAASAHLEADCMIFVEAPPYHIRVHDGSTWHEAAADGLPLPADLAKQLDVLRYQTGFYAVGVEPNYVEIWEQVGRDCIVRVEYALDSQTARWPEPYLIIKSDCTELKEHWHACVRVHQE